MARSGLETHSVAVPLSTVAAPTRPPTPPAVCRRRPAPTCASRPSCCAVMPRAASTCSRENPGSIASSRSAAPSPHAAPARSRTRSLSGAPAASRPPAGAPPPAPSSRPPPPEQSTVRLIGTAAAARSSCRTRRLKQPASCSHQLMASIAPNRSSGTGAAAGEGPGAAAMRTAVPGPRAGAQDARMQPLLQRRAPGGRMPPHGARARRATHAWPPGAPPTLVVERLQLGHVYAQDRLQVLARVLPQGHGARGAQRVARRPGCR